MHELIKFVPALPLLGFLIIGLFGKYLKNEKLIGSIASAAVFGSFLISFLIFLEWMGNQPEEPFIVTVYEWIGAGNFSIDISFQADQLSILFALVITGVGFLIHVYSIGYMHGDRSFYRFFAYLNLFIFMMLILVLADNFLLTFLGWEGVGLCSYLLIGFWYDKKFDGYAITWTGDAANKAFIVNRIGDFGFLIAMFLLFFNFGTLSYIDLSSLFSANPAAFAGSGVIVAVTLLLFLGCTGKSAQIPLAVWLPDAMAGPTPVSALIHAATMVTAGIYLVARNAVMFSLAPETLTVIAIVGVATAFIAASVGLVQNDFKKVLAYSTVSQLGFMFIALGVGAFTAGVFHVMTHAFFKGLLFLGSGSVIHAMHEEQNIKKMGGLKKYMPVTYFTFLIATFAISGVPFFAGFFSKDDILWNAYSNGNWLLWLIGAVAALFTAFYMYRLVMLVFNGDERFDHNKVHPHESPRTMTVPLMILAALSALGGFLGVPYVLGFWFSDHPNLIESFLHPVFADAHQILGKTTGHEIHSIEYVLMIVSVAIAIGGILLAKSWYTGKWEQPRKLAKNFNPVYKLLWNKYYLDNLYHAAIVDPIVNTSRRFLWKIMDARIIDGIVNGSAKFTEQVAQLLRRMQTGIAQNYATLMMLGILIIISWLILAVN